MQKLKKEKGITLIILIITILVMALISVPIFVNSSNVTQFEHYTEFKEDLDNLKEAVGTAYYNKEITDIGPEYKGSTTFLSEKQNGIEVKNPNDNGKYYVINVNKLNQNLTVDMNYLNFGLGNIIVEDGAKEYTDTNDVYIINEQSRTIYYASGVKYNGEIYYRLSETYTKID